MGDDLESIPEKIYGIEQRRSSGRAQGLERPALIESQEADIDMKRLGLIINPAAGLGGSVGLKGTDHMAAEAIRRGAVPAAGERAKTALLELLPLKEELEVLTYPGAMGGDAAKTLGFTVRLLEPLQGRQYDGPLESTAADTAALAEKLKAERVDLILFAGGDGTARDVCGGIGTEFPALGIPAGVKIHSPVYAASPKSAGRLALLWLLGKVTRLREQEVLDIDEDQYRQEKIATRLFGYLSVPVETTLTQCRKSPTPMSEAASIESIAHQVVADMEPDTDYLIGAGTTTRGVMQLLGLPNTLIGVDLVRCGADGEKTLAGSDLYGEKIMEKIRGRKVKLVVTVTGGQGYLFGRGNQQLTPEVLRYIGKENIVILATKEKLAELRHRPLYVDTNDAALNQELSGYYRVITAYGEFTMCRVCEAGE